VGVTPIVPEPEISIRVLPEPRLLAIQTELKIKYSCATPGGVGEDARTTAGEAPALRGILLRFRTLHSSR
jgi:hypothetical protein